MVQVQVAMRTRLTKQSNLPSNIARIANEHWKVARNHNPRVGGSSPSSGIGLFAGIAYVYRELLGSWPVAVDRSEPPLPLRFD